MSTSSVERRYQHNHYSHKVPHGVNVARSEKSCDQVPSSKLSCHCLPHINPFVHEVHFSKWEKFQNYFIAIFLLPIRIPAIFLCLFISWIIASIALYGRTKEDEQKPLSGWRSHLRPLLVFLTRCMYFAVSFHWITVRGERASSQEAPILAVAPHSSFFDSVLVNHLGLPSVVAKTSTLQIPFYGTLTKYIQPVCVSREDPNSRHNTMLEIRRRAATGGEWPQIVIFPEGTCTNRSCIVSFKAGAFVPGVPVQPVCIKYPVKHDTFTWTWHGLGALDSVFYTLSRFHTPIEFEFLPVYVPSEAEKKDPMLFARNVRAKLAEALGLPTTEHSYEDGEAMLYPSELSLPVKPRLVNVNMLLRQLKLKVDQSSMDKLAEAMLLSKTTSMDRCQFARLLSDYVSSDIADQLFTLYIEDNRVAIGDVIDVRQCILELYLIGKPKALHEVLAFAYRIYGGDDKHYLTSSEFSDLMSALFQRVANSHGKPDGHLFTYDDVVAFVASLDDKLAELLIKNNAPVKTE